MKTLDELKIIKAIKNPREKLTELFNSDSKFHLFLVKNTENKRLVKIYTDVYNTYNAIKILIKRNYKDGQYMDIFINDHRKIIKFILNENYKNAKEMLSNHIDNSKKVYMHMYKSIKNL